MKNGKVLNLKYNNKKIQKKKKKNPPSIKQKQQETHTDSKHTQVMLCTESEFVENVEEYLDVIAPEKYIISNFNETIQI